MQSSETSLKVPFRKGTCRQGCQIHWCCCSCFKAHLAAGDYHDKMNRGNFFKWLKEKLVPNLQARSILTVNNVPYHNLQVDNVPYHNLQVDKCPTQASRKAATDKENYSETNTPFLNKRPTGHGSLTWVTQSLQICRCYATFFQSCHPN